MVRRLLFLIIVNLCCVEALIASETMWNIAEVAGRVIFGVGVLTRFLMAACFIVGTVMVVYAIAQYRLHRQNPKFVPLERPVLFAVLGCVLLILPFFGRLGLHTGSALDLKKHEEMQACSDIDAPLYLQK